MKLNVFHIAGFFMFLVHLYFDITQGWNSKPGNAFLAFALLFFFVGYFPDKNKKKE